MSSAAPSVAPADLQHRYIPLASIEVSKTNPRKHFDEAKLDELKESILRHGVLQPILVRPAFTVSVQKSEFGGRWYAATLNNAGKWNMHGTGHDTQGAAEEEAEARRKYELVAGERRFRATRAAGSFDSIPAVVMDLDDKQVLEIQVVENLQRADLHPLEEAEGYAKLIREHGYDVDALALKIGKSKSYVYGRLKLSELCDEGKKACYEGTLPHSHALEIARIPDAALQQKVLEKATERLRYGGEILPFRDVRHLIKFEFQLHLKKATFDTAATYTADGALPHPCTVCPHRSGNQADLFDDFDDADVCTLPPCFHAKEEVAWQAARVKNASGLKKLPLSHGRKIAPYGYVQGAKYLDVTSPCPGDAKRRKIQDLLPKDANVALLRDGYGKTHKVIAKKDLEAELERAGVKIKAEETHRPTRGPAARDWKLDNKIRTATGAAIAAAVELAELTPELEGLILRGLLLDFEGGTPPVLERLDLQGGRPAEVKWAAGLSRHQLFAYLAESLYVVEPWAAEGGLRDEFLAMVGVDLDAIEKQVTREHRGEKEVPPEGASESRKRGKKKKAAEPGTCRSCGCTEDNACDGGCVWANDDETLCSRCAA